MRCMACGVEMQLVGVVPDETGQLPGYARHNFECPACRETETRLLLLARKPVVIAPQVTPEPVPVTVQPSPPPPPPPPSAAPAPVPTSAPSAASQPDNSASRAEKPISGAWARAMTMLRRRREHPGDNS